MKCLGCYTEVKAGYCLNCRKKLFDKKVVPTVLDFDAPESNNFDTFQELSKGLSISGAQLKYSLLLDDKTLKLTISNGHYILKPIPPRKQLANIAEVPENEHLTMQIAQQLFGIKTANNALIKFKDGHLAYITKRFDVMANGKKYLQEDFAQITNRSKQTHGETFKYDGSYEEVGLLIKKYVAAAMPALESFFHLIVFNYVFSNGDAHLKNFSLLRNDSGEYVLTPAYDLLSTIIHTPNESDVALDLYEGDIDSPFYSTYGYYGRENFLELAKRLGIVTIRAARIIDSFAPKFNQVEVMVNQSFLSEKVQAIYIENLRNKINRIETFPE